MLSTLDIMTCMKKVRFFSRLKVKVGHQGPVGSARAQPCILWKMGAFRKEGWRGIPVLGCTPNTNTPPFVFSRPFIYLLTVCRKKMKTHTLFKQRSNALELWWIYSWKFNLADATFTLKNQGPVRKMAYIILNFISKLLFDETHQVVPIFLDFVIALCYWNHNTLFSKEGMITTCQELD